MKSNISNEIIIQNTYTRLNFGIYSDIKPYTGADRVAKGIELTYIIYIQSSRLQHMHASCNYMS